MTEPLTADDLLPLVAKLSPLERARFLRLLQARGDDASAYRAVPPRSNEFSSEEDGLAWESDGWEQFS